MNQYRPNPKISAFIEEKNIPALREYIGSIIYSDRAFLHGEFESAIKYVAEECYLVELFEPFNETPILKSKLGLPNYENSDFTEAIYELKNNFCRERIEDVKVIGKSLYQNLQIEEENKRKHETKKSSFLGRIFRK